MVIGAAKLPKKIKLRLKDAILKEEEVTKFTLIEASFPLYYSFDSNRVGGKDREVFIVQPMKDEEGTKIKKEVSFDNIIVCSYNDLKKLMDELDKRKVIDTI